MPQAKYNCDQYDTTSQCAEPPAFPTYYITNYNRYLVPIILPYVFLVHVGLHHNMQAVCHMPNTSVSLQAQSPCCCLADMKLCSCIYILGAGWSPTPSTWRKWGAVRFKDRFRRQVLFRCPENSRHISSMSQIVDGLGSLHQWYVSVCHGPALWLGSAASITMCLGRGMMAL